MKREEIIHKLTLRDTSNYRIRKSRETGVAKKEPIGFRSKLYAIYDNLSDEQLMELIKLKEL
jgi:hypothetical protein